MTRILLATLAFYRRWLSPALHSLSPGGCSFSHLLGVRRGRDRHARPAARHRAGHLAAAALPSLQPRRPRSSAPGCARQDLFPTNRYHRKSGGPTAPLFSNDRKYPLPEIHNPNLQSQGPGGGGGGGDMRSTMVFMLLADRSSSSATSTSSASPSRQPPAPAQTQSQIARSRARSPAPVRIGAQPRPPQAHAASTAAAAGHCRLARDRHHGRERALSGSSSPIAARR